MDIEALLRRVRDHECTVEAATRTLRFLPYEDIGVAKVDTHRALRRGFPEVIFGQGKTPQQVIAIAQSVMRAGQRVIVTRVGQDHVRAFCEAFPEAQHFESGRILLTEPLPEPSAGPSVCVLSAGTADLPVAEEAAITVQAMGYGVRRIYDVGVAGIHRLLDHLDELSESAILIVVAGMEGALASVVAGLVDIPVVAVPTSVGYGASFSGVAPLLTMLNSCSTGVAVMNIDNGFGAGSYAALLLRTCQRLRGSDPPGSTAGI